MYNIYVINFGCNVVPYTKRQFVFIKFKMQLKFLDNARKQLNTSFSALSSDINPHGYNIHIIDRL